MRQKIVSYKKAEEHKVIKDGLEVEFEGTLDVFELKVLLYLTPIHEKCITCAIPCLYAVLLSLLHNLASNRQTLADPMEATSSSCSAASTFRPEEPSTAAHGEEGLLLKTSACV